MKIKNLFVLFICIICLGLNSLTYMKVQAKTSNPTDENIVYGCILSDTIYSDKNGNLIGNAKIGDMLIVLKKFDNYSKVIDKKTGLNGYIDNSTYTPIYDANMNNFNPLNEMGVIKNVESSVNIRIAPSIYSKSIGNLKNNTRVVINGKVGDWYKIKTENTVGYIYSEYVHKNN